MDKCRSYRSVRRNWGDVRVTCDLQKGHAPPHRARTNTFHAEWGDRYIKITEGKPMDPKRAALLKDTKDLLVTRVLLLEQKELDAQEQMRKANKEREAARDEADRMLRLLDNANAELADAINQRDELLDAIEDFHEAEAEATMRRRRLDASNGRLADLFSRFNASRMAVMNAMSFQPVRDLDNDTVRWQRRG